MATLTLTSAVTLVKDILNVPTTPTVVSDTAIKEAVKSAVNQHNAVRPAENVEDVIGNDGYYYDLSDLTDWDEDSSEILTVEYPAPDISDDELPTQLDRDHDWELYRDTTTTYIRFKRFAPVDTDSFRIRYTYPRIFVDDSLTLPEQDVNPVIWLSVALTADSLASYFARSLAADVTGIGVADWANVAREYRLIGDRYREMYDGYAARLSKNMLVVIDTDRDFPRPHGSDYLHHKRRSR